MEENWRELLFARWQIGSIMPDDACLTCRCLSVIDKSCGGWRLNAQPGCFSPIRITVWSGFAGCNHTGANLRVLRFRWITALRRDATDHAVIPLCRLCKSHVARLISILLRGSGWTWSSLVVQINSDSRDYRVLAAGGVGVKAIQLESAERAGLSWARCRLRRRCLVAIAALSKRSGHLGGIEPGRKCRCSTSCALFMVISSNQIVRSKSLRCTQRWEAWRFKERQRISKSFFLLPARVGSGKSL